MFWGDEAWRSLPPDDAPVFPFDSANVGEAKYVMAIGEEVYLSSSSTTNIVRSLSEGERFTIGPGQFAYILTHETVRMPAHLIGFISINAKTKFLGLVNISGFHVDPGYNGKIIFAVFNAGPGVIHLRRGERIFPIWVAALDRPGTPAKPKKGYGSIPSELINGLAAGNYTTAFELNEIVRKSRVDIDELRTEIAQLKSTRLNLVVLLGILALLFSGLVTDRVKSLFTAWTGPPSAASPQPIHAGAAGGVAPSRPTSQQPPSP